MSSDAQPAASCPDKTGRKTEILHRLLDHWFGPTAHEWTWYRRFAFAFAGSTTFALAWSVHVVSATGISTVPDFSPYVYPLFTVVGVLFAILFAALTAWKDRSYGPVRLYLSGFLLPYLVWGLVVFMLGRELPRYVQ